MAARVSIFECSEAWSEPVRTALGQIRSRHALRSGQETEAPCIVGGVMTEAGVERPAFLEFVRRARMGRAFRGTAMFLGFRRQNAAARQWSLLGDTVPGTRYCRMPLTLAELDAALILKSAPLDDQQLEIVVRLHCSVDVDVQRNLHRAVNLLNRIRAGLDINGLEDVRPLTELADAIRATADGLRLLGASDLAARGRSLADKLQTPSAVYPTEVAMEWATEVEQTMWPAPSRDAALRMNPSHGLDSVLIVDDDGYPADALAVLTAIGYQVSVERSATAAINHQSYDPHAVVVCDMTLGDDPNAGERLIATLREREPALILIALSAAPLLREIETVDGVCAGTGAKTVEGAERLHGVICAAAARRGATL